MTAPKVSIGVPVFNGERYLGQAIESLLAQTFEDFEILISDNASTDDTEAIARSFAARNDRVMYVRNNKNIGAAGNFQKVFNMTSGNYFKWAAHDDICEPQFLEKCVAALDRDEAAVLSYTRIMRLDPNGTPFRPFTETLNDISSGDPVRRFATMLRATWCLPVFGLIRRDSLRQTSVMGNFMGADHVLLTELATHGRFIEIPELLFGWRNHPKKYSHTTSRRSQRAWWDPERDHRIAFDRWRKLREHLASIARSRLDLRQQIRCYGHVTLWAMSNAKPLAGDVVRAIRAPMSSDLRSPAGP